MSKYQKTKYPNILTYEIKSGTRYRIRKKIYSNGESSVIDESGFKNLAHAKARLREIEDSVDKSEVGYIRSKKLTVAEYYDEYSKRKSRSGAWSADTRYGNDSLYRTHIIPVFGNIALSKLSRANYEVFIADKLKSFRRQSIKSVHIAFMAMLNDAVYNGIIERNRLMRVEIGKSTVPPRNKRVALKDYQSWMGMAQKVLTKYEYSIVYLCVFGLRRGEVCGLRESVISYDDHPELATMHIVDTRTPRTSVYGKGGTKYPSSERYIVLDKEGTAAIEYIIKELRIFVRITEKFYTKMIFCYLTRRRTRLTILVKLIDGSNVYLKHVVLKYLHTCSVIFLQHKQRLLEYQKSM